MDSTANPVRVELFVRSLCPEAATQQQNYVLDRLQALEDAGCIEDLSILIWGRRIEPRLAQRTAEGRHLLAGLPVRRWERDSDVSLDAFDWQHPVTNMVSDESATSSRSRREPSRHDARTSSTSPPQAATATVYRVTFVPASRGYRRHSRRSWA